MFTAQELLTSKESSIQDITNHMLDIIEESLSHENLSIEFVPHHPYTKNKVLSQIIHEAAFVRVRREMVKFGWDVSFQEENQLSTNKIFYTMILMPLKELIK